MVYFFSFLITLVLFKQVVTTVTRVLAQGQAIPQAPNFMCDSELTTLTNLAYLRLPAFANKLAFTTHALSDRIAEQLLQA